MTSSTSSSDLGSPRYLAPTKFDVGLWLPPGADEGGCAWWKDRTAIVIMLFLLLATMIAFFRTDVGYAEAPKWYWIDKLTWSDDASVIVAGDSRVYRGVDPDPIQSAIGGVVKNFGFSGTFVSHAYLRHSEALLDPNGPRILIIGVTRASLRVPHKSGDGFSQARAEFDRLKLPVPLARFIAEFDQFIHPVALDLSAETTGARASAAEYSQTYYESGWIASNREVVDPVANGLVITQKNYDDSPHSDVAVSALFDEVRELCQGGVKVFMFLPPVPPEVRALEDSLAKISRAELRCACESSGAQWVDVPFDGLRTYDGSHLDGPSARLVGEILARAVADALRAPPPSRP